jgi:ribose-phosphate pyrophosphokinase
MLIVSGSNQHEVAVEIASSFACQHIKAAVGKFSDQELKLSLPGNFADQAVFIFQSTCFPASDNLMELFLIADTINQASPKNIEAVIPYFGYSRQDRKLEAQPISKNMIFRLLASVGINAVTTLDMHSDTTLDLPMKLYNIPFWQIFWQLLSDELSGKLVDNDTLIVSPDAGSSLRAKVLAEKLGLASVSLSKTRMIDGTCVMNCANTVLFRNKNCILIDDIADNASTLFAAANFLHTNQAKSINACVTHGVFSGSALELIERSLIKNLYITDSVPQNIVLPKNITIIPARHIISNFIKRVLPSV